jgi:hypothetical protein
VRRWGLRSTAGAVVLAVLPACGGGDKSGEKFADAPSAQFPVGAATTPDGGETVLVRDDFSDANSGWDEADADDFAAKYTDGHFQLTVKLPGRFGVSSTLYEGPRNRPELKELGEVNVELSGVGKPAKGGAFGVVCRARGDPDALDYYGATIDGAGEWAIVRQAQRQRVDLISGTSSTEFGSDSVRLRLECIGAQGQPARLRIVVNGRFRGEAVDNAAWPSGGVGFAVASADTGGVVAQLDDLVVSKR